MRSLILIASAAVLSLSACATVPTASLPTPSTVAQTTKLDEQAVVSAHLAYKTFRLAVETGVNAKLIKGKVAGDLADLDNELYTALSTADAAYAASNASSYDASLSQFNLFLTRAHAIMGVK